MVFAWVKILGLPRPFVKWLLRSEHGLDFIQSWVLKMVTKVEQFDITLLKANGYIGLELGRRVWNNLLLADLRLDVEFSSAERLEVVLNDIEPDHFHFDFGKVGELPKDYLMTHVERQEYVWT